MRKTKVVTFFGQKGGGGKSTDTVHTAVEAERNGVRSIIFDCDPQKSACSWGAVRSAETPSVVPVPTHALFQAIARAAESGIELVVIDSPPHTSPEASEIAKHADLIIIPVRPSPFEVDRVPTSAAMARAAGKIPHILLSRVDRRQKTTIAGATEELAKHGAIIPVSLGQLSAFEHAIFTGQSVSEINAKSTASREIAALWAWIEKKLW